MGGVRVLWPIRAKISPTTSSHTNMLSRIGLQAPSRFAARTRTFKTSAVTMNSVHGTPKEGIYSNLPFKVKDRKIPFGFVWWGTFGFFFAFPFLSAYWHMKKAGNI